MQNFSIGGKKQSILHRPIRKDGYRANLENIDKEYEEEQRRLEARRRKYNEIEERRRKMMWGTPEEKLELQFSAVLHLRFLHNLSQQNGIL